MSNIFYGLLVWLSYCLHYKLSYSIIPLWGHFIVSLIYLIIWWVGILLFVKANNILPFDDELCDIYLVFHIILLFLNDTAIGIVLQSPVTINYGLRHTVIYISYNGYFHFSFILYLNTN